MNAGYIVLNDYSCFLIVIHKLEFRYNQNHLSNMNNTTVIYAFYYVGSRALQKVLISTNMHPYTRVNEKERLTRQLTGSIITETFVKKKNLAEGRR